MSDAISDIYAINDTLAGPIKINDNDKIQENVEQYNKLINYVTSDASDQIKQLCADYIPRYIQYYNDSSEAGINKLFDLLEDSNTIVRIHSIKGLDVLCKNMPSNITRVIDVLVQFLIADEQHELVAIKSTLTSLCNIDFMASITTLFNQYDTIDDNTIKQRVIEFILSVIKIKHTIVQGNNDIKNVTSSGIEQILINNQTLNEQNFTELFNLYTRYTKFKNEHNGLITDKLNSIKQILHNHISLNNNNAFDINDETTINKFKLAVRYTSGKNYKVDNSEFIDYWFDNIYTQLNNVSNADNIQHIQPDLYKLLFVLIRNITQDTAKRILPKLYDILIKYLPSGNKSIQVDDINYQIIEILLYCFHLLCTTVSSSDIIRNVSGLYNATGQPNESGSIDEQNKRSDFVNRLEHLKSLVKEYKTKQQATINTQQQKLDNNKNTSKDDKDSTLKIIRQSNASVRCGDSIIKLVDTLVSKNPTYLNQHLLSYQHGQKNKPVTTTKQQHNKQSQKHGQKRKSYGDRDSSTQQSLSQSQHNNNKRQSLGNKPYNRDASNNQRSGSGGYNQSTNSRGQSQSRGGSFKRGRSKSHRGRH